MTATPAPTSKTSLGLAWYLFPQARREMERWHGILAGSYTFRLCLQPGCGKPRCGRPGCGGYSCPNCHHQACGENYTDFATHRVVIDPETVWGVSDIIQIACTRGQIAHEDGHTLFTTVDPSLSEIEHRVANLLEDERIERAMMELHWGTDKYLLLMRARMFAQFTALDASTDDPREVIRAMVHVRFGHRLKGHLSPTNQERYQRCQPFMQAAWEGASSADVNVCARQIVAILGLTATRQPLPPELPPACATGARPSSSPAEDTPGGRRVIVAEASQVCPDCGAYCPAGIPSPATMPPAPDSTEEAGGTPGAGAAPAAAAMPGAAEPGPAGQKGVKTPDESPANGSVDAPSAVSGAPGPLSQTGAGPSSEQPQAPVGAVETTVLGAPAPPPAPAATCARCGAYVDANGRVIGDPDAPTTVVYDPGATPAAPPSPTPISPPSSSATAAPKPVPQDGDAGGKVPTEQRNDTKDDAPPDSARVPPNPAAPGEAGDGTTDAMPGSAPADEDAADAPADRAFSERPESRTSARTAGTGAPETLPAPDNSPRDRFDPGPPIEEWQATIAAAHDEVAKDVGRWLAAAPPVTRSQIAPADINDLLPEAALAAVGLARALRVFPPVLHHHAAASGNRYSMRDAIQHPTMPFRKREVPAKRVKIALGILVDCSYSMGGAMPDVRKAALMLYLAGAELDIPVGIWAFSDWQQDPARTAVPFGMSHELAPAYIGGLAAAGGTRMAPALTNVLRALRERPEERRLLLVIHDGADDIAANKRVLTQEARDIDVIGIYIGQGENTDPLRQLFGTRLVVAPDVRRLSTLLGNLLQRVAGVH